MRPEYQHWFAHFEADDPQAIESVLGRQVRHFAYYVLKAMLPHVAEAVRLWEAAGLDSTTPFVWNDLDCHLTIAISPDRARILVAELNSSAIEHCFPVFVFEGHEPIAGRAFEMKDLKSIRMWQAFEPIENDEGELPAWPDMIAPETLESCLFAAGQLTGCSDDAVHPKRPSRPSLAWLIAAMADGLPKLAWFDTALAMNFRAPRPDLMGRGGKPVDPEILAALADDYRLMADHDWHFRCTLQQFHAGAFMLRHAAEALARGVEGGSS